MLERTVVVRQGILPGVPEMSLQCEEGLFSNRELDDGTAVLLGTLLSEGACPESVMDVGCGYGAVVCALGLSELGAATRFTMFDRDAVAVAHAKSNVGRLGLAGRVKAFCSLDDQAVEVGAGSRHELVLANLPARIGKRGLGRMVECASRHTAERPVRVVVIHDVAPTIDELALERGWKSHVVTKAERHTVYDLVVPEGVTPDDWFVAYARDEVSLSGVSATRPFDASEDPSYLGAALPLLLATVPEVSGRKVLLDDASYGLGAKLLAERGAANVRVVGRDALLLAFSERNTAGHASVTVDAPTAGAAQRGDSDLVIIREPVPARVLRSLAGVFTGGATPADAPFEVIFLGRVKSVRRMLSNSGNRTIRLHLIREADGWGTFSVSHST